MRRRQAFGGALAIVLLGGLGAVAVAQPWQNSRGVTVFSAGDAPPPESPYIPKGAPPDFQREDAAAALWKDFPVDADPRPIVLVGNETGFRTPSFPSPESQAGFENRLWNVRTNLPASPGRVDGYPVISAERALKRLRPGPPDDGQQRKAGTTVTITRAVLATLKVRTDRGEVVLPAWKFTFAEAKNRAATVLAVGAPALFRAETGELRLQAPYADHVEPSPDGRSLTVYFTGAEPGNGPCQNEYEVRATGNAAAVVILIRPLSRRAGTGSSGAVVCPAVGYGRMLTVQLSEALGNKVVVTDFGAAVEQR